MSGIRLEDEVLWTPTGDTGRVIGLTTEPSAIVEFSGGRRITIGLSKLEKVESPLPTEPGYYAATEPGFGGTVVVELLNRPRGQWVDAGDRNYLDPDAVRALGPLVRLEPRAVTAKAVLDRVRGTALMQLMHAANPKNGDEFDDIARDFGVDQ